MVIATGDPRRFQLYHESLRTTILRTSLIALVLGTIGSIVQHGHRPLILADAYAGMVLVLSVLWISLGGHWVELAYLNALRPRIARMPDWVLVLVRLAVWLFGGTVLLLGAVTTRSLLATGQMPSEALVGSTSRYGGLIFAAIELVAHTVLAILGRPSFWNLRG